MAVGLNYYLESLLPYLCFRYVNDTGGDAGSITHATGKITDCPLQEPILSNYQPSVIQCHGWTWKDWERLID